MIVIFVFQKNKCKKAEKVIDDVPDINSYINLRVKEQIRWYDKKAIHCRKRHETIQILAIILTSLSSFSALLSTTFPKFATWISISAALFSTVAGILLAIDKLKKYQELHSQYRKTCERVIQELCLYQIKSGEYRCSPESNPNNDELFVDRCESIFATENGNWAQLNEKKEV